MRANGNRAHSRLGLFILCCLVCGKISHHSMTDTAEAIHMANQANLDLLWQLERQRHKRQMELEQQGDCWKTALFVGMVALFVGTVECAVYAACLHLQVNDEKVSELHQESQHQESSWTSWIIHEMLRVITNIKAEVASLLTLHLH